MSGSQLHKFEVGQVHFAGAGDVVHPQDGELSCGTRFLTRSIRRRFEQVSDLMDGPPFRIRSRVSEHVKEDGLDEDVELGEGGAALGSECLCPVQDLRNPQLLRQWREGNRNFGGTGLSQFSTRRACGKWCNVVVFQNPAEVGQINVTFRS
jgi:hypothetical protein